MENKLMVPHIEEYGDTTKIISLDLVKENVECGDTSDYKTSKVKKMCL